MAPPRKAELARRSAGRAPARTADGRMSLVEHLYELRSRLAKALAAITVGVVLAFLFWLPILAFLQHPYCQSVGAGKCALYAFGPLESFAIRLKVSSIAGVVLSAPIWLYQLGAFITPALHRNEKRYAAGFLAAGTVLFGTGCFFAYITLNKGLSFLLHAAGNGVITLPSLRSYLNFVTLTLFAFGIAFLFPVLLVFLNVVGILPSDRMRAWRRGMIVGIAVASAVITPSTDPYTFTFMAVPLYGLYEVCIVIARVRERATRRRGHAALDSTADDDRPSQLTGFSTPSAAYGGRGSSPLTVLAGCRPAVCCGSEDPSAGAADRHEVQDQPDDQKDDADRDQDLEAGHEQAENEQYEPKNDHDAS